MLDFGLVSLVFTRGEKGVHGRVSVTCVATSNSLFTYPVMSDSTQPDRVWKVVVVPTVSSREGSDFNFTDSSDDQKRILSCSLREENAVVLYVTGSVGRNIWCTVWSAHVRQIWWNTSVGHRIAGKVSFSAAGATSQHRQHGRRIEMLRVTQQPSNQFSLADSNP